MSYISTVRGLSLFVGPMVEGGVVVKVLSIR
jgi:hypothetical protein